MSTKATESPPQCRWVERKSDSPNGIRPGSSRRKQRRPAEAVPPGNTTPAPVRSLQPPLPTNRSEQADGARTFHSPPSPTGLEQNNLAVRTRRLRPHLEKGSVTIPAKRCGRGAKGTGKPRDQERSYTSARALRWRSLTRGAQRPSTDISGPRAPEPLPTHTDRMRTHCRRHHGPTNSWTQTDRRLTAASLLHVWTDQSARRQTHVPWRRA